jgi:hypothetical protein
MKNNCCAYILSPFPIYNNEKIKCFESLAEEDSSYLYSTFLLNYKEILASISDEISYVYCLAQEDKDHLPQEFLELKSDIYWQDLSKENSFVELENKFFKNYRNNLILFLDAIGFSGKELLKAFNLLSIEDDSMILGKTDNFKLSFFGFNKLDPQFFGKFDLNNLDFDTLLSGIPYNENFIHVLGNYMLIKDKADFKNLYKELSKKESYEYCSERIHGRFTNLFIEYKDLLK